MLYQEAKKKKAISKPKKKKKKKLTVESSGRSKPPPLIRDFTKPQYHCFVLSRLRKIFFVAFL